MREFVLPRLARGRPNVVALNEDVGLLSIATGSRGRAAREVFINGGAIAALTAVTASYAPVIAAYESRFTSTKVLASGFWAATDTFARGWMQMFSDLSKRYGVYMLGLEQPDALPRVDQLLGDRRLPRPRHPATALGLRRAGRPRLQRGVHVGAAGPAVGGAAHAAQRRHPEPQGAAHRHREGRWSSRPARRPAPTPRRTCAPTRCRAAARASPSPPRCPRSPTATPAATPAPTPPRPTCAAWTAWGPTS